MKVLRVIRSMDPASGGPCQGIRNSIPELFRLGQAHEVVSLDDPKATFLEGDEFPIYALGPARVPWSFNARLLPWLLEHLPEYDAVIIHGLWLYHGYAVRQAVRKLTKRRDVTKFPPSFYVMPHGMLDPYFQRAPSRRFKSLRNFFYWKVIEKKVVNEAAGILFTCEEELRLAREPFKPYSPKAELNVGYGVAEPPPFIAEMRSSFAQKCPGLDGGPYFLFLSRIHPKKGVEFLIRAFSDFIAELKALNAGSIIPSLVIAGPIDSDYAREMQKLASQLFDDSVGPKRIYFPGMVSGPAKWGAFYGCDAFVLPSHQENFGIAVVEALACSKPVLISNKINIWRELEKDKAAIVNTDTLEGTRELFRRWINLPRVERIEMNGRAKNSFKKRFTIESSSKKLLAEIS